MVRSFVLLGLLLVPSTLVNAQGEFRLGAGDEIQIDILGESDLVRSLTILPDGTVTYPYLRAFQAAGMTPQELDDYLTSKLSEYLIRPEVTITVRTMTSKRVYVFGEVNEEGPMLLTAKTRLIEALSMAGSFNKERANLREVTVLREEEGERRVQTADLQAFLVAGGTQGDMVLEPGDLIYVPTKIDRIYVFGEVLDPGVYPHEEGMTVLSGIGMARGFLDSAANRSVIVVRNSDTPSPEYFRLDLYKLAKEGDHSDNILLQPNDIVIVPKKFISKVAVFVRQWLVDVGIESVRFVDQAWNLRNLDYRTKILRHEAKDPQWTSPIGP